MGQPQQKYTKRIRCNRTKNRWVAFCIIDNILRTLQITYLNFKSRSTTHQNVYRASCTHQFRGKKWLRPLVVCCHSSSVKTELKMRRPFQRHLASISSRVRPFVSGTMKYMKKRDSTHITPNPQNRTPAPNSSCKKQYQVSYNL